MLRPIGAVGGRLNTDPNNGLAEDSAPETMLNVSGACRRLSFGITGSIKRRAGATGATGTSTCGDRSLTGPGRALTTLQRTRFPLGDAFAIAGPEGAATAGPEGAALALDLPILQIRCLTRLSLNGYGKKIGADTRGSLSVFLTQAIETFLMFKHPQNNMSKHECWLFFGFELA